MRVAVAAVAALVGCGRTPIRSCADDLRGEYAIGSGETWAIVDDGATLEAYPTFADVAGAPRAADPGVEVAPRMIVLHRATGTGTGSGTGSGAAISGRVHRRYGLRGEFCTASAPFHITRCAADQLEVVRGDPQAPLAFAPCSLARAADSRVETWRRR